MYLDPLIKTFQSLTPLSQNFLDQYMVLLLLDYFLIVALIVCRSVVLGHCCVMQYLSVLSSYAIISLRRERAS